MRHSGQAIKPVWLLIFHAFIFLLEEELVLVVRRILSLPFQKVTALKSSATATFYTAAIAG